jgi:hypothetical protein
MTKTKLKKRVKTVRQKTRVTVDFPIEKHKRLKAIAALKGETLQEFILNSVEEKMAEPKVKNKLDMLDELGLVGTMNESQITSENYKEFISKSIKRKYEK